MIRDPRLSEYLKGHSGHQVLPGPSRAFQESSRAFLEYSRTFKGLPRIFQAFKRLLGVFQGILGPFKRLSGLSTVFQSLQWPSNVWGFLLEYMGPTVTMFQCFLECIKPAFRLQKSLNTRIKPKIWETLHGEAKPHVCPLPIAKNWSILFRWFRERLVVCGGSRVPLGSPIFSHGFPLRRGEGGPGGGLAQTKAQSLLDLNWSAGAGAGGGGGGGVGGGSDKKLAGGASLKLCNTHPSHQPNMSWNVGKHVIRVLSFINPWGKG